MMGMICRRRMKKEKGMERTGGKVLSGGYGLTKRIDKGCRSW